MSGLAGRWTGACLLALAVLWPSAAPTHAQTVGGNGGALGTQRPDVERHDLWLGGESYGGTGTVTWTLDPFGEPEAHRQPLYKPFAPPLPASANARVMIQDRETGEFVTYGSFLPGSNRWIAEVPEGRVYVAMFCAPGHEPTSRVFDARSIIHDTNGDPILNPDFRVQLDTYMPSMHMDLATGTVDPTANPELPLSNLLVFAFSEQVVNGAPDEPFDTGLPNVLMELLDPITGAVVTSGVTLDTGYTGPTGQGLVTKDGLVFPPWLTKGLLYLEDYTPGEYLLRATPPDTHPDTGLPVEWYYTYTMEGGREWEIVSYPGDPGTEFGAFMAWFGFAEKIGQVDPAIGGTASISGVLEDADVGWEAPMPGEPPEPGMPLDPVYLNQGVSTNGPVPDGFVVLWQGDGPTARLIATTDAHPTEGTFSFTHLPAGEYMLFLSDKHLNQVFGEIQVVVNAGEQVVLPTVANEIEGGAMAITARFCARVRGFVVDQRTGIGIPGATVNVRFAAGDVRSTTVTDDVGWYNFDALGEIETMAFIDVEPPPGSKYRGALVWDTYYPQAFIPPDPNCTGDPSCPNVPVPCNPDPNAWNYDPNCVNPGRPVDVQRNGMGRYVQWYTANYQSQLFLEPIPRGVGQIQGYAFDDSLAHGTWEADGQWDKRREGVVEGVTLELVGPGGAILATTKTGTYDEMDIVLNQGYIRPGITVPPDEWGGFKSGPMLGFYEFRDVRPGDYTVRVVPPAGYFPSGTSASVRTRVGDGLRTDLDFGLKTLVPRAGHIEGAIFDDVVLDHRWYSSFYEEKQVMVGMTVLVRDYLGYTVDLLVQPSAVCYPGTTPFDPTQPQVPYGAICDRPDLGDSVELDFRIASGVLLYWGNAPDAPAFDPNLFNIELAYNTGQGTAKYEADWSLPPIDGGGGPSNTPICLTNIAGHSEIVEGTAWKAVITLTVQDDLGPMNGALVMAQWSNGEASTGTANSLGVATVVLEKVEDPTVTSVTATLSAFPGTGQVGQYDPSCSDNGGIVSVCSPDASGTHAVIVGPTTGLTGQTLLFDGTLSYCNITSYRWEVGGLVVSADPSMYHLFDTVGTHDVALQVSADGVTWDTAVQQVVVKDVLAVIAGPDGGVVGEDLVFDGSMSLGSNLTYAWDFGDSSPIEPGAVTAHRFTQPGLYVVSLTVTDTVGGGTDTATWSVPITSAGGGGAVIVSSLTGEGVDLGEGNWHPWFEITVEQDGAPLANVAVSYVIGGGEGSTRLTDGNGWIGIQGEKIENPGITSVTLQIQGVSHPDYDPSQSLTTVTAYRPW